MKTRQQIRNKLRTNLSLVDTSTFLTDSDLNTMINEAYIWVQDQKPWVSLEKARKTTTSEDEDNPGSINYYYDYPSEFKDNSVFRLLVGTKKYKKIDFEDFLDYKEANPNLTYASATKEQRRFAEYARQYFFHPVPTTEGIEIVVWGLIQAAVLSEDTSKTIWSDAEESVNEAVYLKAYSYGLDKMGKKTDADKQEEKAKVAIDTSWERMIGRRQRDQRMDHPFFAPVPDFFGQGQAAIGNFRTTIDQD